MAARRPPQAFLRAIPLVVGSDHDKGCCATFLALSPRLSMVGQIAWRIASGTVIPISDFLSDGRARQSQVAGRKSQVASRKPQSQSVAAAVAVAESQLEI